MDSFSARSKKWQSFVCFKIHSHSHPLYYLKYTSFALVQPVIPHPFRRTTKPQPKMHIPTLLLLSTALLLTSAHPHPRHRQPQPRGDETVNPDAVLSTTCLDPSVDLNTHDTDVALLSICGGISGTIEFCEGNPTSTVGASGTSKLTLTPVDEGAMITVSKGRWEGCMRAARAVCPQGTFSSTCVGGVSEGVGFGFVLSANE